MLHFINSVLHANMQDRNGDNLPYEYFILWLLLSFIILGMLVLLATPSTLARLAFTRDPTAYVPQIKSNFVLMLVTSFIAVPVAVVYGWEALISAYATFAGLAFVVGNVMLAFVIRFPSKKALIHAEYFLGLGDCVVSGVSMYDAYIFWFGVLMAVASYAIWVSAVTAVQKASLSEEQGACIEKGRPEKQDM